MQTSAAFFFAITDSPNKTKTPVKRGLGKGGAAARYCTMSPKARLAQYPNQPLAVREGQDGADELWCTCCGKPVSHWTKTQVDTHIQGKKHLESKAEWDDKNKKRKRETEEDALEAGTSFERQVTLPQRSCGTVLFNVWERQQQAARIERQQSPYGLMLGTWGSINVGGGAGAAWAQ